MRAALILLALTTTASAEIARPREATVCVTLAFTGPIQRAPAAKPPMTTDRIFSIEGLASKPRVEHEKLLIALIADTPDRDAAEKADLLYRLGELQAATYRFHRLAGDATAAQDALAKAIKTFSVLVDDPNFRSYPKLDVALFYYGYTLQGAGMQKEARITYDKLLKNFPSSKYVPEAFLAFAEYYFDAGQLADAEAFYNRVLKFPKSNVYAYAMYKRGWIHFNQQRPQEALESFFQAAQLTKAAPKLADLHRAARLDFVRAFATIGKPEAALAAFQRLDPNATDLMDALATIYAEQGKPDKATVIYQQQLRAATPDTVCAVLSSVARGSARATTPKAVEVCASEVDALREWARINGATLTCPRCTN